MAAASASAAIAGERGCLTVESPQELHCGHVVKGSSALGPSAAGNGREATRCPYRVDPRP